MGRKTVAYEKINSIKRREEKRREEKRREEKRRGYHFKSLVLIYCMTCFISLQAQLYADPPIMNGLPDVGIGKLIPEGRLHIDRTNCYLAIVNETSPPPTIAKKHIVLETTKSFDCTFVFNNGGVPAPVNQKWIINGNEDAGLEIETSHDNINYVDLALFNELHTYLHAQSFSFGTLLELSSDKSTFNSNNNRFVGTKHLFPSGDIKFYDEVTINGNMVRTASQNNSLEWYTSGWGADYGHKIYNKDPGNHTELVIAAQHGSGVWKDAINISSDGKVGIGGVTGADFDNNSESLIVRGSIAVLDANGKQFKLESNGNLHAREILLDLVPIPDYVFKQNYPLMSLDSLQEFINTQHHLPGIKSEKEYAKEGNMKLGELNMKLLEKVEEQTLYILYMNRKIAELENKIEHLKK